MFWLKLDREKKPNKHNLMDNIQFSTKACLRNLKNNFDTPNACFYFGYMHILCNYKRRGGLKKQQGTALRGCEI